MRYDGQPGTIVDMRTVERGSGPISPPECRLPPTHEVTVYDVKLDGGDSAYGLEEDHLDPYPGEG